MGMSKLTRATVAVCAAMTAAAVVMPTEVSAKGMASAVLDGPGLDAPIVIDNGQQYALQELGDVTGLWVQVGAVDAARLADRPPTGRLGRGYTLAWAMFVGPGETKDFVQWLFPDAAGGPIVFTRPGQELFGGPALGGWYRARLALRDLLLELGVPAPPATADLDKPDRVDRHLA